MDWPMIQNIAYVVAALILLWKGSDWLVESSVAIAQRLGVSQLVIGLTVVALATSAPEFVVTIGAAMHNQADISVSNVIGSNIFNLGFILGGVAMVRALDASSALVRRDGGVLLATTALILFFLWDGHLDQREGLLLLLGLGVYLILLFRQKEAVEPLPDGANRSPLKDGLVLAVSIGCVVLGGSLLREGAVGIARSVGLSEWVIGATVVAAGTSAPEFVASLVASLKGHHGISAGNLIGSCIFNFLGVLGVAGVMRPMTVAPVARLNTLILAAVVLLALGLLRTGWRLSRREGALLFLVGLSAWIFLFLH